MDELTKESQESIEVEQIKEDLVKVANDNADDPSLVTFTNGSLEMSMNDPTLAELLNLEVEKKIRLTLYVYTMKIFKSVEMEAYQKLRQEIVNEHLAKEKARIKKDEEAALEKGLSKEHVAPVADLKTDSPEMKELMDAESGLVLSKLILFADKLPDSFVTAKMMRLSWLINFV